MTILLPSALLPFTVKILGMMLTEVNKHHSLYPKVQKDLGLTRLRRLRRKRSSVTIYCLCTLLLLLLLLSYFSHV